MSTMPMETSGPHDTDRLAEALGHYVEQVGHVGGLGCMLDGGSYNNHVQVRHSVLLAPGLNGLVAA